jgi:hypothetical protein
MEKSAAFCVGFSTGVEKVASSEKVAVTTGWITNKIQNATAPLGAFDSLATRAMRRGGAKNRHLARVAKRETERRRSQVAEDGDRLKNVSNFMFKSTRPMNKGASDISHSAETSRRHFPEQR